MRVTTGLLLTAILLCPGTVRAQFGGPGSAYGPFGPQPRFGGIPGISAIPGPRLGVTSQSPPFGNGMPGVSPFSGMPGYRGVPGLPPSPGVPGYGGMTGLPPLPGLPGSVQTHPFGQPDNELLWDGVPNYLRGWLPNTPGMTEIGTGFGRPAFGRGYPWQQGGNNRQPFPGMFRAPTAEEIIQNSLKNTVGREIPMSFPGPKLGTVPQTPIPPVVPRIDIRPPVIPNLVPPSRPASPPPRHEPFATTSWARWNWTARIAVLCLVGGLLCGYLGRRRVGI
jgi:hypothetical protein